MTKINPINNTSNTSQTIKLEVLEKMDNNSIWNIFDTDQSGTITDKEIQSLGYIKQAFNEVKEFLLNRFGQGKITNVTPGENYFDYEHWEEEPLVANSLDEIPSGSHNAIRDARNCDISNLNLAEEDLLNLTIDKTTILSPEQKAIIDIYTEKMKDPGLGIRNLHEQGVTGKGVRMAIIDQPLGKHQEYSDNIVSHEVIDVPPYLKASLHGAAVTSIAVGKTTGVAPDAKVEYYSAWNLTDDAEAKEAYRQNLLKLIEENKENAPYQDYLRDCLNNMNNLVSVNQPYVDAINKILDKNETAPENEKVSVISISWGMDNLSPDFNNYLEAIERAKAQGVFVVTTRLGEDYGLATCGANRDPKSDPNNPESYEAGAFFKEDTEDAEWQEQNQLLVPMDHRTVADYQDGNSYRYEGNDGGMSWSTPWLAGMYVLAKQVDPEITPEKFWEIALRTSNECRNNDTGTLAARIINPQAIIDEIKKPD